jgi:hypothetical protein
MKLSHIIILILALFIPGRLPAPDLPPGKNSFLLLENMRSETIKKDKVQYNLKYYRFKRLLGKLESNNNWKEYNKYGYIGKYQFGTSALNATGFGHITFHDFKLNPSSFPEHEQEKAMDVLLRINETVMAKSINKYVGLHFFDTLRITRMGILAAAHLAGPANVKEFLDTFGEVNVKDRLGTYVSDYIYRFSR